MRLINNNNNNNSNNSNNCYIKIPAKSTDKLLSLYLFEINHPFKKHWLI